MNEASSVSTVCGFIAIIGRPNVGKSTLLNQLIRQKISITSRKAQTTRHQIIGIDTQAHHQLIYIDTPGLHQVGKRALNRYMNRTAIQVLRAVDVIVVVIEALKWQAEDEWVIRQLTHVTCPVILAVNKIDQVKDKATLLPFIDQISRQYAFSSIIPISAQGNIQLDVLRQTIIPELPSGPFLYAADQITDRSQTFLISEIIREQLFRLLGDELPYSVTVVIEQFEQQAQLTKISGLILVDKPNHKQMIIGHKGQKLKQVGQRAREQLETLLASKVYLQLWVKVKSGWSDNATLLTELGYTNQ
ncbi:MAG: GTPase Era [Legionellales bacterium]|nr:GTPase Era [Legionellales bacterium]